MHTHGLQGGNLCLEVESRCVTAKSTNPLNPTTCVTLKHSLWLCFPYFFSTFSSPFVTCSFLPRSCSPSPHLGPPPCNPPPIHLISPLLTFFQAVFLGPLIFPEGFVVNTPVCYSHYSSFIHLSLFLFVPFPLWTLLFFPLCLLPPLSCSPMNLTLLSLVSNSLPPSALLFLVLSLQCFTGWPFACCFFPWYFSFTTFPTLSSHHHSSQSTSISLLYLSLPIRPSLLQIKVGIGGFGLGWSPVL